MTFLRHFFYPPARRRRNILEYAKNILKNHGQFMIIYVKTYILKTFIAFNAELGIFDLSYLHSSYHDCYSIATMVTSSKSRR